MSKKPHKQPPPVQKKPAQRPQPQPAAHKTPAPRPAPEAPLPAWWHALALAFLLLATFLAFRPGLEGELTNWDDNRYVVDRDIDNNYSPTNPFLTSLEGGNIKAMFFNDNKEHLYYMGNYHPLTMLSLSIDYARGGYEARAYKQTNLLLHLLSSLLAYALVWFFFEGKPLKLRFWMASVSALVFGLLAIHVESVTWVSERKDVLYTFFFFASLLAYLLFLRSGRLWAYAASLALFVLSLFSKGQAVSLSVTLVAIDLLRGRDWRSARLWVEKAPFFALSLLFGVLAFKAQSFGEAVRDVGEFSYFYQILFAFYGYTMYFVKMLVPNDLAAMYPYPIFVGGSPPAWYFSFLFPVLLLIGLFFWSLRRHPALAFGLAFFTINVFLVLQFVGVGSAIMADRYAYVPSLGFGIMLAWVLQWAWERRPALKLPVLAPVNSALPGRSSRREISSTDISSYAFSQSAVRSSASSTWFISSSTSSCDSLASNRACGSSAPSGTSPSAVSSPVARGRARRVLMQRLRAIANSHDENCARPPKPGSAASAASSVSCVTSSARSGSPSRRAHHVCTRSR